jgi:hypothetical protein
MAENLEREARRARSAYLGSVQRLGDAMRAFHAARVPLNVDEHGKLAAWSRDDVQVMLTCAAAWADIVKTRRHLDVVERDLRRPAIRPYA